MYKNGINDNKQKLLHIYVTVVQSTVPRFTGEFDQPPMLGLVSLVWLGIHTGGYLSTDDTERSHF